MKTDYKLQKTTTKVVTIEVNDNGDHIAVNADDATLFDRFSTGYKRIVEISEETQKKVDELAETYKGKDDYNSNISYTVDMARLNVGFSNDAVAILDGIFGEGTIKKYFRDVYEELPDFLPGVDCILGFVDTITPVMEQIFNRKMEEQTKRKKERMAKYQPQNYKKK